MKLIKCSSPGWEKEFASKDALLEELRRHICNSCLTGVREYVGEGGVIVVEEEDYTPDPNDLGDLLSTACGCEYEVEE